MSSRGHQGERAGPLIHGRCRVMSKQSMRAGRHTNKRRVGLSARPEAVSSRAKMPNEWVRSARTKCESDHSNTKLRAQRVVANCLPAWVATKKRQRGVAHAREKNGGCALLKGQREAARR